MLHDLENLLLLGKPPIQSSNSSITSKKKGITGVVSEPYNRSRYCQYATDNNKAFGELYTFCFALAKPQYVTLTYALIRLNLTESMHAHRTARNIDIDVRFCQSCTGTELTAWRPRHHRLQAPSGPSWSLLSIPSRRTSCSSSMSVTSFPVPADRLMTDGNRRRGLTKESTRICGIW